MDETKYQAKKPIKTTILLNYTGVRLARNGPKYHEIDVCGFEKRSRMNQPKPIIYFSFIY
jgi:hypothetical protein